MTSALSSVQAASQFYDKNSIKRGCWFNEFQESNYQDVMKNL